jgi:arabinan endo-1,5-alpha-L-arabinosidase
VFDQGSLSRDASFLANVSELTISAWYKNVVVGSTPMFSIWGGDSNDFSIVTGWGDGTEIGMGFNTDSGGGFYSFGSGTGIPDDGQYHHVVMVYSSSNSLFRMFVEGNQVFSEVITGALCTAGSLSQLVLGSQTESINSGSGSIDAVGIWNRALSDAEVAALYNSGNGLELEVTLETGLQAFYKLSDLYDSSGNNRTLTNNGNVSFASGKLGNAAVFDETNSLDIPENLLAGKTQASVSLWVKTTDNDGYLVSAGGLEGITVVNEGGVFTFNTVSGYTPIQTPQFINDGEWHHCVATFLNGDVVLYIDGQQSSTGQTDSVIADSGKTKMTIGKQPDDDWASFVGQIDAVGIWNRALSDAEVAELYNNGTGLEIQATLETGLQAFYKLSDLSDSSGNNRTLTNNGNVSFASGKLGNAAQTGDGSYLTLPSNAFDNVQGDFTVTAFIKIGDQSIDKWSTWFFCNFDDELCEMGFENRQLRCNFFGPNEYSGIEETANEWFFASVTASAQTGTLKIYRNGVLVASTTSGSREERSLNIGIIGGNSWSGGYFDGQIDAVGIWNRALSDAEVAELYNNGTGLELPAPAGPTVKNGWINNIYWINDVATTLDQNGDGTWVGKLYENGSLFSGSKYSLTFVDGVAQAEQIVTVIGNNIPVAFGLNEAEEPLVELVFASITSAGETVIEQIVPTVLPTGYTVAETVLAYSIDTTATFEGSINVDFILPSNISQAVFDRVKGFHVKNSGAIEEMTRVSSDFSTKRITVAITSFSDFLFLDTPPASGKIVKIQGNVKFYGNVKFAV